jgi:hypothetical protein
MIVRLIAVDPRPRQGEQDVVVYQVPEHSRAQELLCELLDDAKIEWVVLEEVKRRRKKSATL